MTEISEVVKTRMVELINRDGSKYKPNFLEDPMAPVWATSIGLAFARFIQQVSDAAKETKAVLDKSDDGNINWIGASWLAPFILPEPVDPLQQVLANAGWNFLDAKRLCDELAKRGLKIVEDK